MKQHLQRKKECKAKEQATRLGPATCSEVASTTRKGDFLLITKAKRRRNDASPLYFQPTEEEEPDNGGDFLQDDADIEDYVVPEFGPIPQDSTRADRSIIEDFRKYVANCPSLYRLGLRNKYHHAMKLMLVLRQSTTSLDTYESIMEWHYRANNKLRPHEPLHTMPDYVSRKALFSYLKPRYNVKESNTDTKEVTLPHTRAKVGIVKNDFRGLLQSLLADPRILDSDYLFIRDNPLAKPVQDQKNLEVVGDINTSRAYIASHRAYIKDPSKQILLPIIFYIDSAATGQFANLPVCALKFTLGIFNMKAREKDHMWRVLGYVPVVTSEKSKGKRLLAKSGHADASMAHPDLQENEGCEDSKSVDKAQDFHAMLDVLLQDVVELEKAGGFIWDLFYKNKEYNGIHFVTYTHMIKADTDEADKHCGHYKSRTKGVKQLCRYCCCPTEKTDDPNADFPLKTIKMIGPLRQNNDAKALKELSQQNIDICWYKLCFGAHSDAGIHGSCPLDVLHAVLLGTFKYTKDCFFAKMGKTSAVAKEINSLAVEYGELFQRQSNRDMPKTRFPEGINKKGKLQAKEYIGVLLLIAVILQSDGGKNILKGPKENLAFAKKGIIDDWIMLVETLLMWHEWLMSDELQRKHVLRLKEKHKYLMYLIRKVGCRTEGMGMKIMKFHGISHMADDILNFGVPRCTDTGSDEKGHKPYKKAAKLTQKRKETFDRQVETRVQELYLLDMANAEMETGRSLWSYYMAREHDFITMKLKDNRQNGIGGSTFQVTKDTNGALILECCDNLKGMDRLRIEAEFVQFFTSLARKVGLYTREPVLRTIYTTKDGTIYRGTSLHMQKAWRDWVLVDWGGSDGTLPAKIWGFVDLSKLRPDNTIQCGGLNGITPGIYAIVENANYKKEKKRKGEREERRRRSELFLPIVKEIPNAESNSLATMTFYLANVDDFVGPVTVVPNVGGQSNSYLMLKGRPEWRKDFERWLVSPYESFQPFEEDENQENYNDTQDSTDNDE